MDPDNVTKPSAVEAAEDIKTGKEPQDVKLTEKNEEQKVVVPLEDDEMNKKDSEPIVDTEKTTPQTITTDVSERKEEIAEAVAEIIKKKQDDIANATDDEKEENDPVVGEKQAVPADEIAIINKEEKPKVEFVDEPLKIEEPVNDMKKDDDGGEKGKENKAVEGVETKDNVAKVPDTANEPTDAEKLPAVENVKTESKEEEKTVEEKKATDSSTGKEEEKTSPKTSSISLMGKVKKSFMKAKKAITGKTTTTTTTTTTNTSTEANANTKTTETKKEEKA